MQAIHVPTFLTRADRARARVVRSAEENRGDPTRTPDFFRDGLGLCRTVGDPEDFVNPDTRYVAGKQAHARAAAICAECPFSPECLRWASATAQTGVFGGEFLRGGHHVGR